VVRTLSAGAADLPALSSIALMVAASMEPRREQDTNKVESATCDARRMTMLLLAILAALYGAMAAIAFAGVPLTAITYGAAIVLAAGLIALTAIDIRDLRLPDWMTWPLLAAGLSLAAISSVAALAWHMLGAAIAYGAFWLVAKAHLAARGTAGLGGGDAKLLAAGGAWTGPEALPTIVFVAAVTTLLAVAVAHLYGRTIDRDRRIPFGPFLAAGIWHAWLFGPLLPS
jgi:leader peptidase (prepilin peptidase) / N-methyltransferase